MRADSRLIQRPLRAALALLAMSAGLAPAAARADGGVGYRVDGEDGSVIDGGFIRLSAAPGGIASGHFYATNSGSRDATVTVYASDGLTGETTGIVYSDNGDQLVDAGGWTSPSASTAGLPAGGDRRIDFTVRVPSGARPGDHVGGVVLEQRRGGSAISQIVRNVVPVLVDVSGGASPSLSLRSALVSDLPGTSLPAVTVKMVNTGGRICRPVLTVALVGQNERGDAVTRQLDAILPGDSAPYPLPWPRMLDKGMYTASVSATGCGATATMRTDVHSDVTAESAPSTSTSGGGTGDKVITKAAPGAPTFTPPEHTTGVQKTNDDRTNQDSSDTSAASASGGGSQTPPTGVSGSGTAAAGSAAGAVGKLGIPKLKELGRVAIKYLPPLLERLIAPLSLLGLMLLFLFAQETFDRKDPKLALAPIHRDPDLEFLPLDDGSILPDPNRAGDLEVVRSPTTPRPVTP